MGFALLTKRDAAGPTRYGGTQRTAPLQPDRPAVSEARGQADGERPQIREHEGVDGIERPRLPALVVVVAGDPDLRVETAVARERHQVARGGADVPVPTAADAPDMVGHGELTQFRVARVLHAEIVGSQNVVEPAKTAAIIGRRGAVVVA